jgi:hypothetical protein
VARYVLVRNSDGRVMNSVEFDSSGDYVPAQGFSLRIATSDLEIGGVWTQTQLGTDKALVTAFLDAPSGTASPVQRDNVIKAIIRYLRRSGNDA